MTIRLLDNAFSLYHQGYQLTRVCKLDSGHKVRARVRRDSYKQQSYAVAEALTPALTWTELVAELPDQWFATSPYVTTGHPNPATAAKAEALLDQVATRLLDRAAAVLA